MSKQKLLKSVKNLSKDNAILIAFIIIFALLSIIAPNFLTQRNFVTILKQSSIIGTVSLGMTIVIISGNIDLSVGSMVAVCGIVSALMAHNFGLPFGICLIIGVLSGGLIGLMNGVIIAKGKVPSFIVTLGMMTALRGLGMKLSDGVPIGGLPDSFSIIGEASILRIPITVLIFLAMAFSTSLLLKKTCLGRHIFAIGGNEQAARLSGINIDSVKLKVFIINGLVVGLAGVMMASRIRSGQPSIAVGYELDAIAACIIGGVSFNGGIGSVYGTILGTLILAIINNGLDLLAVQSYYQQIIKGLIIVAAVLLDRKRAI